MTSKSRSSTTSAAPGEPGAVENPDAAKAWLLDRAVESAPDLGELLRTYFRHAPAEELSGEEPAELVAALRSHRVLAADRVAGRPLVKVLNPSDEPADRATSATVVQLVTDDMPYLVDSVIAELTRQGAEVQRIIHPIVVVRRDAAGSLLEVRPQADPSAPPQDALAESWMLVELDRITDADRLQELEQGLLTVLSDVRGVVEDTERMLQKVRSLADSLDQEPDSAAHAYRECAQLLRWLADGHFTFLGYRHNEVVDGRLQPVLGSGLGVLRGEEVAEQDLRRGPDVLAGGPARDLLVLTQASEPSTVHRSVHPFYVGVKTFDADGAVTGEHRLLGLFTTTALHENVLDIPLIEHRVRQAIHGAGFPMESFSGQRMLEEIQNYPRTELFSTDLDTLRETVTGVLALAERRKLKPFVRRDSFGRFFSCLVYLPRDRYTTRSRLAMQEVLLDELRGASVEYSTRVGESALARVHFVVHTKPGSPAEPDLARIQQRLSEAIHTWEDQMVDEVDTAGPETEGKPRRARRSEAASEAAQQYAAAFPEAYKEDFGAAEGLHDLRRLESLTSEHDLRMSFYTPHDATPGERRFKIYVAGERVTLSRVLPVLQSMGVEVVDERPYEVVPEDGRRYWIYDFGLCVEPGLLEGSGADRLDTLRERFEDAFRAAWLGEAEVDRFNSLVLRAGLSWRQASVLRAYGKYLRQTGVAWGQEFIADVILTHRATTVALTKLFETRFDPKTATAERAERQDELVEQITSMIDDVTSLNADRILRSYLSLISATLRTNYFVDGGTRPYLSMKLEPQEIPGLPEPRPQYEIFVCSPRVEGVHLRFGSVARGGLRWSDRHEDFRTEILGLVKAQAVKNAVIVPVGAKGGFVVKRPPMPTGDATADREASLTEGISCYRMFISGLLDLTDNLTGGEVDPPHDVVRHDGDDTYLVVAADKGTATFSDIANDVAASYGFWLGDAFASGGSVGYDHKAMGITAKGAWESVKRHFREIDVDTQRQDFTVVGVGDMAGDVFGNGMLLSEHIKLVAAFNHLHVFIDPAPDPAGSYAERRRLFDLPRSTWDDYDRGKISEGGGVWSRSLKSIPLNDRIRAALGIDSSVRELPPNELIKAVLQAPADLLWNGGIGTYVKAAAETHAEVGDKANDAVRVDGGQLRAKVVGEGGNLGFTQLGRIEFSRAGGKINTDALDNSAGVDCSDHEVNIKVLLDHLVAEGRLDGPQRNELLASMTDEVSGLVLADNYRQNAVLGISRAHAAQMMSVHARQISWLEEHSTLDRELEALPGKKECRERDKNGTGLTSPELATLLAHVKLALKHQVLDSDLPEADAFSRRLPDYFPEPLRERYGDAVPAHPLRRQITTTLLVNEVVDGGGVSYAYRLSEELTASATDAVRAFAVVTGVFDLPELWRRIDELDNQVSTRVADDLVLEVRRLLDRASRWLLQNRPQPLAIGAEISRFRPVVQELSGSIGGLLCGRAAESAEHKTRRWIGEGVPADLAERIGVLLDTYALLDITEVAELAERDAGISAERSPGESAELYYLLSEHLDMERLLQAVNALERGNRWHSLARLALRDDLYSSLRALTIDVLRTSDPEESAADKIAQWETTNASRIERAQTSLDEIKRAGGLDLATLSVATRQLRSMVR